MAKFPSKVLILGGAGFIGTNLSLSAIARGARVVIFDSLVRCGVEANLARIEAAAASDARKEAEAAQLAEVRAPSPHQTCLPVCESAAVSNAAQAQSMAHLLEPEPEPQPQPP